MKKFLTAAAFCIVAAGLSLTGASAQEGRGAVVVAKGELRAEPNVHSTSLRTMMPGTRLEVFGDTHTYGWKRVTIADGTHGWANTIKFRYEGSEKRGDLAEALPVEGQPIVVAHAPIVEAAHPVVTREKAPVLAKPAIASAPHVSHVHHAPRAPRSPVSHVAGVPHAAHAPRIVAAPRTAHIRVIP